MLTSSARFVWVDLQFKAILEVCEKDGRPDRIPNLFESPPRKVTELYRRALSRLSAEDNALANQAKKLFQWIVASQRPLNIAELEEGISTTADQKSWRSRPVHLNLSRLCRMCGNLIKHDRVNDTIVLAHHTVRTFLSGCSDGPDIASYTFEEYTTQQLLADTCLTYLSFTDFHKTISRTIDTRNTQASSQPAALVTSVLPSTLRPFAMRRYRGADRSNKVVDLLRSEPSLHQAARIDPSFRLLEYCKTYWCNHSRYINLHDVERLKALERFICQTLSSQEWKPWTSIPNQNALPYWRLFVWVIIEGHTVLFCIWQRMAKDQEINYWQSLWEGEGPELVALICLEASLERLEIMLDAKIRLLGVERPSPDEIDHGLVTASWLGHCEVVERLLQEKVDINAAAFGTYGRTAL